MFEVLNPENPIPIRLTTSLKVLGEGGEYRFEYDTGYIDSEKKPITLDNYKEVDYEEFVENYGVYLNALKTRVKKFMDSDTKKLIESLNNGNADTYEIADSENLSKFSVHLGGLIQSAIFYKSSIYLPEELKDELSFLTGEGEPLIVIKKDLQKRIEFYEMGKRYNNESYM